MSKNIPDSYMTIDGQRHRVYWCEETGQFESEPVKQSVSSSPRLAPIKIISSGCGTQSFALQVAMAMGLIKFDAVIHANVGDDSENPATIAYKNEVIVPH